MYCDTCDHYSNIAVTHAILLQKIQDELVLVQLECVGRAVPFNSYTKQETCWTKITTFEPDVICSLQIHEEQVYLNYAV